MGEALLSRLIDRGVYEPGKILVSDPVQQRRDWFAKQYGVQTTAENQSVIDTADVLLLAIKPQIFDACVRGIEKHNPNQRVISILAGVPLSNLESAFLNQSVIRAMPNTPATVGFGVTAIAAGKYVQPADLELAHRIFAAVGEVVDIPESLMDAVTGLSGSGPAYVAILIESLADGGVASGLPRAIASQLALQTVLGTAELLRSSKIHPAELKDRVTSPGGTTIAGVAQLEQAGFRSALIEAVRAASQRSKELGKG